VTRRHDALVPLSHDHHHALHNLRLLKQAAATDDAQRLEAARAFVAFFREHSVVHFREEEEKVFPRVVRMPDAPIEGITRVLIEHIRLYALVNEIEHQTAAGAVEPAPMIELADLLKAHIRFEEDTLFPAIEKIGGDALEGVELAERRPFS
jgi:hemerythrin-like domain-containing protein